MKIELPERPRILIIALRRLGDVLLTTPLIRSVRRAWPHAVIDALVFADTANILFGNPDLDGAVVMPSNPTFAESTKLATQLARRYALAISTQTGDRPTWFAIIAGRISVAPLAAGGAMAALKQLLLTRSVPSAEGVHRVEEVLRLADALGIPRIPELVCPSRTTRADSIPDRAYAVIHPAPMFIYKRWTTEGWRTLADRLLDRGLEVVITGGPAPAESEYLDAIWPNGARVRRLEGQLSWPELAALLARARVYVGPDTSVTHLAAASGCPTIALYGPTDPRIWGPWPVGGLEPPWEAAGTIQTRGNVWLVQNPLPCLPCQREGCDRHVASRSRCLDELPVDQVMDAADAALKTRCAESGALA